MIKLNEQTTATQAKTMQVFQELLNPLYAEIENTLPGSREKALVVTKLDEAVLWLREAIIKIQV